MSVQLTKVYFRGFLRIDNRRHGLFWWHRGIMETIISLIGPDTYII